MISITIDKKQMADLQKKLAGLSPKAANSITKTAFRDLANATNNKLQDNLRGTILKDRTGNLLRSIGYKLFDSANGVGALVGSGVRTGKRMIYANIHENGDTVHAKPGGWLTIPLARALTKGGSMRKIKARDYPNTFVKMYGSYGIIFQKIGKKSIAPLFLLKKSVKIPGRKYMSRTVEAIQPLVNEIMGKSIEDSLKKRTA